MSEHLVVVQKPAGGKALVKADLNSSPSNHIISDVACETDVYVGACVVMQASGIAKNAIADGLANSNVIGIIESKTAVDRCVIRVANVTLDLFAGLDVTKEYYLSSTVAGAITTSIPTISGTVRLKIGQPFSSTQLLIMKGDRMVRS